MIAFEAEHGADAERLDYNSQCMARARREGRTVVARRLGFTDFFVPVGADGVIATGPIANGRPTSVTLLARWRTLTGRRGELSDPEFSHYVTATLKTLTLDGKGLARYRKLVETFASLLERSTPAEHLYARMRSLGSKLGAARLAERTWQIAAAMIDERSGRIWRSPVRAMELSTVGIRRYPARLGVGLFVDRRPGSDPVAELLRRDEFQRACVLLCQREGDALCGRIGDYGVALLSSDHASQHLLDRATALARDRFGLVLHSGRGSRGEPLDQQFVRANAVAESALAKQGRPTKALLSQLGRELVAVLDNDAQSLPARFDQYLNALALHTAHRLEPARTHLEAVFDAMAGAALGGEILDRRSLQDATEALERRSREATTLGDLFTVYRRVIADLAGLIANPRTAARDRSIARAEEYMRRHCAKALTLAGVARIAGYEPTYFSKLFHRKQGATFESYLLHLRVERARQLLSGTKLPLERVAVIAGFRSRAFFHRAFKRVTRETPAAYRDRIRTAGATMIVDT
ncbi:MAG TPA: AraC family transcriptional regulator [Polyangiaceae bacterium]|nr:AraC family transcriptional regulator [Polyangiaceae bacterium]